MCLTSFNNQSLFFFNSNSHSSYFIKIVQENRCTIIYSCAMTVHVSIMLFTKGGLHIFPILDNIVSKHYLLICFLAKEEKGGRAGKTKHMIICTSLKAGKFSPKFIDNKKTCGLSKTGPYQPESYSCGKLAEYRFTDFFKKYSTV